MSEPKFLTLEAIEFLHQRSIHRYGGTLGIRDRAGLESAVMQPLNTYYYGHGDLFDIAAAYAFHVAEAQAFLDGNKRTAIAACLHFLEANALTAIFNELELYHAMIGIAERRLTKRDLAALLRDEAASQGQ